MTLRRTQSTRNGRQNSCERMCDLLDQLRSASVEEIVSIHTSLVHFTVSSDNKTALV